MYAQSNLVKRASLEKGNFIGYFKKYYQLILKPNKIYLLMDNDKNNGSKSDEEIRSSPI
jgi:hypothetical protein